MATHSSIPSWSIPKDRGAWQATVHAVAELDTTNRLNTHIQMMGQGTKIQSGNEIFGLY